MPDCGERFLGCRAAARGADARSCHHVHHGGGRVLRACRVVAIDQITRDTHRRWLRSGRARAACTPPGRWTDRAGDGRLHGRIGRPFGRGHPARSAPRSSEEEQDGKSDTDQDVRHASKAKATAAAARERLLPCIASFRATATIIVRKCHGRMPARGDCRFVILVASGRVLSRKKCALFHTQASGQVAKEGEIDARSASPNSPEMAATSGASGDASFLCSSRVPPGMDARSCWRRRPSRSNSNIMLSC